MKYLIPAIAFLLFTAAAYAQQAPDVPEEPGAQEPPQPELLKLSPAEMSRQIKLLGSRFLTDRLKAQNTIARVGDAAVPYLKEIFESENMLLRMTAVELLARLKQPEVIFTILEMLEDPSPVIKRSAARAFESYGAELLAEVNQLMKSGKLDPDKLPEKLMARLYRSAVLDLFKKLESEGGQYPSQYAAVAKLGPRAVPAILSLLEECLQRQQSRTNLGNSGRIIVQILNAAPEINDKRLTDRLEKMIKETNVTPSFRQLLAVSLARLGVETYYNEILNSLLAQADEKENDYAFCSQLAMMYHRVGKYGKSEEWFSKSVDAAKAAGAPQGIPYYNLACAQAMGKKADKAVETLKTAVKEGYNDFDWVVKDKELDPIRAHPGYIKLLKEHSPEHLPKEAEKKQEDGEKKEPGQKTEKSEKQEKKSGEF
jgi:tetratricopeptide (TPR) repeat protein